MRWLRRACVRSSVPSSVLLFIIVVFATVQIITRVPVATGKRGTSRRYIDGAPHASNQEPEQAHQGRQVQTVQGDPGDGEAVAYDGDALPKEAEESSGDSQRRKNGDHQPPPPPPSPSQKLEDLTGPRTDWVQVAGEAKDVFVYSAYLDRRSSLDFVRVLAIFHKRSTQKVKGCILYDDSTSRRVIGSAKLIREHWSLPYSAAYIHCNAPSDMTPTYVTPLVDGGRDVRVIVQNPGEQKTRGNLAVCVKPLHYNFNRAIWLVEFVEFYRLLGVDHFILYNHTVGPDVDVVLRYYMSTGLVSVLPWTLPVKSQKDIRTEGIFAALNDCNFRSLGRYSMAAMVDLDEFLVPRQHKTLPELTQHMGPTNVYIFQNIFYYLYWENDTVVDQALWSKGDSSLGPKYFGKREDTPYLLSLFKTHRLVKPHNPGTRSKYIVRPEGVLEVGNHVVWEHIGPKRVKNVPPHLGLSHHYRICEFGGYDCLKQPSEVDRITHRWLEPLIRSVSVTCQSAFPETFKCPPAPPLGSPW